MSAVRNEKTNGGATLFAASNGLTVRLAAEADLDELLRVFAAARVFMREHGNPTQWGLNRPTREEIEENLAGRCCYTVEREESVTADQTGDRDADTVAPENAVRRVICGTFALKFGPDPMYAAIDGKWLSDEPYEAIHALASDGTARGVADLAFRFAETHPSRFLAGQLKPEPDGTGAIVPDEPVRFLRVDTHRNNRVMQSKFRAEGFTYCGIVRMIIDGTERLAFEKRI